jgi:hypothetical protein
MSADVHKVCSNGYIFVKIRPVSQTDRYICIGQDSKDFFINPALVSEFKGMPDGIRLDHLNEIAQTFHIGPEIWRQLPKHNLKFFAERRGGIEKCSEREFDILELLDMGDKTAPFEAKTEIFWRFVEPSLKRFFF